MAAQVYWLNRRLEVLPADGRTVQVAYEDICDSPARMVDVVAKHSVSVKIRTMRSRSDVATTVTTTIDPRITRLGRFFRRTKIDERPQLWNVLIGDMSFVGPRPDVPGFADRLEGRDRVVLTLRPGITGPATLKYRDEESMLAAVDDPERYSREVVFPDKVRLNREYINDWSLLGGLRYMALVH